MPNAGEFPSILKLRGVISALVTFGVTWSSIFLADILSNALKMGQDSSGYGVQLVISWKEHWSELHTKAGRNRQNSPRQNGDQQGGTQSQTSEVQNITAQDGWRGRLDNPVHEDLKLLT